MSRRLLASRLDFTLTGTGVAVSNTDLMPLLVGGDRIRYSGRVNRFFVRQAAGGGATAGTFSMFTNRMRTAATLASPSTAARDNMTFLTASVVLTASASTPSLDTTFDSPPVFKDSMTLVVDVTAGAGAWTLLGY